MQAVKMQIQIEVSFFHLDRIFNDPFTHVRDPTSFFLLYQLILREQVCLLGYQYPPFDEQTNMSAFVDEKVGLIICLEAYVVYIYITNHLDTNYIRTSMA